MTDIIQKAINHIDTQAEKENDCVKIIAQYIIENLIKTDSAAEKILNDKLTLNACFEKVKSNAKAKAAGGCACVEDAVVFRWVREYYGITAEDLKSSDDTADILNFDIFAVL